MPKVKISLSRRKHSSFQNRRDDWEGCRMTFSEFCEQLKVTEAEAHELVWYLAAFRQRQTVQTLLPRIVPDKTGAKIVEELRTG
jgi:Cft2 family RNA processing exonuclease